MFKAVVKLYAFVVYPAEGPLKFIVVQFPSPATNPLPAVFARVKLLLPHKSLLTVTDPPDVLAGEFKNFG